MKKVRADADLDGIDDVTGSDGRSVFIENSAVQENSQIFVTAKTMIDQPLVVTEIRPGKGFKVEKKDSTDADIVFSWWIIVKY